MGEDEIKEYNKKTNKLKQNPFYYLKNKPKFELDPDSSNHISSKIISEEKLPAPCDDNKNSGCKKSNFSKTQIEFDLENNKSH